MIWFSVLMIGAFAMTETRVPLGHFETDAPTWTFSPGAEFPGARGRLEFDAEAAHAGERGARLVFDFTGGGNYVAAEHWLREPLTLRRIEFWVKKPAGTRLTVRVGDSTGQTLQKSFQYAHEAWQHVSVNMHGWTGHWGGANDGRVHMPVRYFAILAENTAPQKRGVVFIDQVEAVPGAPEETSHDSQVFEYVTGEPREATYDFERIGALTFPGPGSLFGKPQALKLRVEGDIVGHGLQVQVGSHFQHFEYEVTLQEAGEVTIPIATPEGWRYFGGENDGIFRYPLRLLAIRLVRGDGPPQGRCRLEAMRVQTRLDPQHPVVLIAQPRPEREVAITAWNLLPEPLEGTLTLEFRGWEQQTLRRQEMPWALPSEGRPASQTIRVDVARPFVEILARFEAGGYTAKATTTLTQPLEDAGDATLDPSSPFGMGVYLYRYPNTPEGHAQMDRAAALAQAAGVKWSREEFSWAGIERQPGQYDWSRYDAVVETATRHGISIYGLLAYWSPWSRAYTPEGIQEYCDFARAVVKRYQDRIKHWEVWNEPNIFFWQGPREMYADLLKAAYQAIKETDPEAKVLGISTAGIDLSFIRLIMERQAPFDILTIHPYRARLDDRGFIRELQQTAQLTAELGDGRPKPLWITEMGWPTHIGGVSEREQAQLLARCYLCAVASGVAPNVSWYDFRNDGTDPFYNEHNFGVLRHDMTPKPAYRALATVCRTLAGKSQVEEIPVGDGILGYRFSGAPGSTVVLWSRQIDRTIAWVANEAPSALNLMGEALPIAHHGGDEGRSLFHVLLRAESPIFLEGLPTDALSIPIQIRPVQLGSAAGGTLSLEIILNNPLPGNGSERQVGEVTWEIPEGWHARTEGIAPPPPRGSARERLSISIPPETPPGRYPVRLRWQPWGFEVGAWVEVAPRTLEI